MKKRITILIAAVVVIAGAIAIKTYIDYRRAQDEMYRKIEKRNREKRKFGRDIRKARSKMKRLQKRLDAGKKKAEKMGEDFRRLERQIKKSDLAIEYIHTYNQSKFKDKSFVEWVMRAMGDVKKNYDVQLELKNERIYGVDYALIRKAELDKERKVKLLEANLKQELKNKEVAQKILNIAKKIKQYEEWEKLPDEEWDKIADKIKLLPDDDGKDEDEKDDEKDE